MEKNIQTGKRIQIRREELRMNLGDVAKAHNKGAEISLQHAADGVTIPFHPGAAKYLKEKGALK